MSSSCVYNFSFKQGYDFVCLVNNQIQSDEFGILLQYMNNTWYNPILCPTCSFMRKHKDAT